jgi:hypothetical protein
MLRYKAFGQYLVLGALAIVARTFALSTGKALHPSIRHHMHPMLPSRGHGHNLYMQSQQPWQDESFISNKYLTRTLSTAILATTTFSEAVFAKDGQYGILEGKWAGLVHPIYFIFLFGVAIAAAYQGFQWRRGRELTAQINKIKSNEFAPQLYELRAERDRILKSDPKGKHISLGSIILGSGNFHRLACLITLLMSLLHRYGDGTGGRFINIYASRRTFS